MNISQKLDQATNSLEKVDWKEVFSELSELWILLWKIVITLVVITKVSGEALGNLVHLLNDILAANWVRMLGLSPIPVMEDEENEEDDEVPLPTVSSPPTEVGQAPLPVITEEVSVPTPPAVKVELPLPTVAKVVEILELDEQPPPTARRRRRGSAPRLLEETVNEEVEPPTTRRPRGPKAHRKRVRRTLAA